MIRQHAIGVNLSVRFRFGFNLCQRIPLNTESFFELTTRIITRLGANRGFHLGPGTLLNVDLEQYFHFRAHVSLNLCFQLGTQGPLCGSKLFFLTF